MSIIAIGIYGVSINAKMAIFNDSKNVHNVQVFGVIDVSNDLHPKFSYVYVLCLDSNEKIERQLLANNNSIGCLTQGQVTRFDQLFVATMALDSGQNVVRTSAVVARLERLVQRQPSVEDSILRRNSATDRNSCVIMSNFQS